MGIFSKISEGITGAATGGIAGLASEALGLIKSHFPGKLTPQEESDLKLQLQEVENKRLVAMNNAIHESMQDLNSRIAEQEGTAKDLMQLGWLGKVLLALRGTQRPIWGFATLYMDWQWFNNPGWQNLSEQQQTALILINGLVLGFLFGERAFKNLEPLLTKMFAK